MIEIKKEIAQEKTKRQKVDPEIIIISTNTK